ncbi:MAG: hypothetical protein ACYTKD_13885 [Planctomycetota bacterium]|jgi:hypothetical protein
MFRRAGVGGFVVALVFGAAVTGCGQKGGGGIRPTDAFGLANADVMVTGDLASVAGSKFYTEITKEPAQLPGFAGEEKQSIDDTVKSKLGLGPADVQRIVAHANFADEKLVVAALAKGPVDRDAVIAGLSEGGPKLEKQATHAGVDLYAEAPEDDTVLAFPQPNLVVAGAQDAVKKGIDRLKAGKALQAKGKAAGLLSAASKGSGLVVVVVPTPALAKMAAGAAPVPGIDDATEMISAVTVVAKAAEALDLGVVVEFKADKDAEDARKQAKEGLAEVKKEPMLGQGGMEPLKAVLDSIKIGGAGKCVEIKATARADVAKTVPALMGLVMMKMMGGGAPGMGGGMPMQ